MVEYCATIKCCLQVQDLRTCIVYTCYILELYEQLWNVIHSSENSCSHINNMNRMSQKQWKKWAIDEYSMKSCMLIGDRVSCKTTNNNRGMMKTKSE